MYHLGDGVSQNYGAAVTWYTRSAKQGNNNAQVNLGQMYLNGLGVKQDNVHAYKWWKIAKLNGDRTAAKNIVVISKEMTSDQILNAEKLVNEVSHKKAKDF